MKSRKYIKDERIILSIILTIVLISLILFALRQTQWDEEERGDKRRRKTIRKRERQRG